MVINRYEKPINTIINDLRNSANGRGDSWNSSGHGFKNAHGEPLIFRGKAVHRGTLEELLAFCARDPSVELAAVGNTELCRKRFILFDLSVSTEYDLGVGETRQDVLKIGRLDANKVSTAYPEL